MLSTEFLLTTLVVVLIPGTGVIYTLSVGLIMGQRASFWAALGCTFGIVPAMLASILGLLTILHMSALAFQLLKFAGVAYLLYMAWSMWRQSQMLTLDSKRQPQGGLQVVCKGFLINILNPKLSLFFLAFLPQFVPVNTATPVLDLLILGLCFMLMTLVIFSIYGLFAACIRNYFVASPKLTQWFQRSFAVAFAFLGARLVLVER